MGAAATSFTVTTTLWLVEALSLEKLSASVAVDVTVRVNWPSWAESAVTDRCARSQVETSIGAPVLVMVFVTVPSLRTTPAGTPETDVEMLWSGSDPTSPDVTVTGIRIAVSSAPLAVAATLTIGASATSFTVTTTLWLVEALSLEKLSASVAVDVTVRVNWPSWAESAVTDRCARSQVETSIGAPVLVMVFVTVPSLRTTPAGTPETDVEMLWSGSDPTSPDVTVTGIRIAVSSAPLAVAATLTIGASATSFTVTTTLWLVEALSLEKLSASVAVDVTVRVNWPSWAESAVTDRCARSQVETSIGAPVLVMVFVTVPSLRTTPAGTPETDVEML